MAKYDGNRVSLSLSKCIETLAKRAYEPSLQGCLVSMGKEPETKLIVE